MCPACGCELDDRGLYCDSCARGWNGSRCQWCHLLLGDGEDLCASCRALHGDAPRDAAPSTRAAPACAPRKTAALTPARPTVVLGRAIDDPPRGFDESWARSPVLYTHVAMVLVLLVALLFARTSLAGGVLCLFVLLVDGAISPMAITLMASAAYAEPRAQKVCGAFMIVNGLLGFAGLVVSGLAAVSLGSGWLALLALLFVVYACVWLRVGAALLARDHDELTDDGLFFDED